MLDVLTERDFLSDSEKLDWCIGPTLPSLAKGWEVREQGGSVAMALGRFPSAVLPSTGISRTARTPKRAAVFHIISWYSQNTQMMHSFFKSCFLHFKAFWVSDRMHRRAGPCPLGSCL